MNTNSEKPTLRVVRIVKLTVKTVIVLFALLFGAALLSVLFGKDKEIIKAAEKQQETLSASDSQADAPVTVAETHSEPSLPTKQAEFINIINGARDAYSNAANEMLEGKVRVDRKQKLCKLLNRGRVDGWIGTIAKLESSSEGKGVLAVEIEGEDIFIKTWNNDFSDILDHSMINPNSDLFNAVSRMSEGDRVLFSGGFYQSKEDCFKEVSITQRGSVTEPEFLFRFSAVKAID